MSPTIKLNVCIVLLVIISRGLCREAACSKFHYEERLLEKMIRQEIKVEQMETEIKNTLQSIGTFMSDIKRELKEERNKISTFMTDTEQRMNTKTSEMDSEIKESLNNKVSTIADTMKTTMDIHLKTLLDKVTVPKIAFNSYNLKDVDAAQTQGDTFIFTEVILNEGDGYDSNTGVFTAPLGGLYYFTVHMCNHGGKYVYYGIIVDSKTVAASEQYDKDHYTCNSVGAIVELQDSSTVSVQSTSSSSSYKAYQDSWRRVSFNGVLLHR